MPIAISSTLPLMQISFLLRKLMLVSPSSRNIPSFFILKLRSAMSNTILEQKIAVNILIMMPRNSEPRNRVPKAVSVAGFWMRKTQASMKAYSEAAIVRITAVLLQVTIGRRWIRFL